MNYALARQKGTVNTGGRVYARQRVLTRRLVGGDCRIGFSIDKDVKGAYVIIDADDLQPSHLGGSQNPLHFIPEAQPRNRSASASGALTPERIAQNLRPLEVIEGSTAYSGPPVVNSRGEVIQGNGRAYMMKVYYAQFPKDEQGYKKTLQSESSCLNFSKYIAAHLSDKKITKPVLVRMVDITDTKAIELGQFTQADTEAVATAVTKIKSKVRLLTEPVLKRLINELSKGLDSDDKTLSELIRESRVLSVLVKDEILRADDLENYTRNGTINEAGVDFVSSLLLNATFRGADVNTPDVFTLLPVNVQNAVKKSTIYLLKCSGSKSLNREVSGAVLAFREYQTANVGSLKAWLNQFDLQGKSPLTRYNATERALVSLFAGASTQKEIVSVFRKYSVLVNSSDGDMFTGPSKGKTKREALQIVLGVAYKPDTVILATDRKKATGLAARRSGRKLSATKKATVKPVKKVSKAFEKNTKRLKTAVQNAKIIREAKGYTTETVKHYSTPWKSALKQGFALADKGVTPGKVKQTIAKKSLTSAKRKTKK